MRRLILKARGITRVFQVGAAEVHALRGVDLALPEGDFAAILGPPGAGKSTLLRILGFVDSPTAGDLYYQGRLVTSLSDAERALLRSEGVTLVTAEAEQRLALCGALDRRPTVLLVDEPGEPVAELLRGLVQGGLTVLLTTGDPEVAARCLTVYRMRDGVLRRLGS
ncbi:MAG TPA: ATP-binding cassette domain-containing protein [Symbiobacteriaceae bacterium]|nr:ATP-binding cassette domain-containing protein [Symbiobacteriaceae bacterium]